MGTRGYSLLPEPFKRLASQLDYQLASKPRVYSDERFHLRDTFATGVVTISLDFEMAWAWQYAKRASNRCVEFGLREREQVPQILKKFEEFHIPATWATVGHLFLRNCTRGADGLAHPHMPRVPHFETERWRFDSGDWYQFDPCSDVDHDPAWYAPDLIDRILSSRVKQEIGCHSFSHVGFGSYCPPEVAAAELEACVEAMAPFGLRPETWVFPASDEGNFVTLAQKGIRTVRAFPYSFASISLPILRDDGMWAVHVSSAIDRGKYWTLEQRLTRLKEYVDLAAATKMAAHVWLHPSLPIAEMENVLFPFLSFCADEQEGGRIQILTMEELVTATEAAMRNERKKKAIPQRV